jgi:hypothetical protein
MNRVERASRYDDRVADSNLIEHALKLGAIAIAARDLFAEDLPATTLSSARS